MQKNGSRPSALVNTSNIPLPEPERIFVQRDTVSIPTSIWMPSASCQGIVLACHGGSGHKESGAILAIAQIALAWGMAVVAIDGPVHGARRTDGNLDAALAKTDFRAAWRQGVGRLSMAQDFITVLDTLQQRPQLKELPIVYIGVSMGTAYGLPLLAQEPRICAAVIGLWSTTYPASEHLSEYAGKVTCPVWFTQQWDDEFFDREGTFALFDAIGTTDKRLVAYPGPHRELEGIRLREAFEFLRSHCAEK